MERKKVLAIVAVFSLIAGCCLMIVIYPLMKGENIFASEPSPQQVADAFFKALEAEQYEAAFQLCDEKLQRDLVSPANFQYLIELYEYRPAEWKFEDRMVSSNQLDLSGRMDFKSYLNGFFQIILRRYDDGWKVAVFHFDHP